MALGFASRAALVSSLAALTGCGPPDRREVVPAGTWGGLHVGMVVAADGATLEFDCAHGRIEGSLALDERGRFAADGSYVPEKGGPVVEGEEPVPLAARYEGRLDGAVLELNIELAPGSRIGPFTLVFGRSGTILKCL